uniref:Uncharacterized protein n=1 Tax=Rhizophagus irregularis (strain DAOM 181602 / DAOM 197198 / MUCL 43194) TaxID=747089 RepID=U9T7Y7_RHIID
MYKVLPKFYKLKTLIVNIEPLSEEQLKMCVFRDLEIFRIGYYELKAASIIIENTGGHLKKIFLGSPYEIDGHVRNFDDNSLIFIRKVYERCLSIEYLSLIFPPSKEHFNEFEKLLKICQNLKSLLLAIHINDDVLPEEELLIENEEILKILIRSSPTNLKEIRFICDVEFSLETLEEFLEKWKGRPALSILTSNYIYREKNYKKLINKYKNNGLGSKCIYCYEYLSSSIDKLTRSFNERLQIESDIENEFDIPSSDDISLEQAEKVECNNNKDIDNKLEETISEFCIL